MLVYLNRSFLSNILDKKFHQGNHNHPRNWIWRKRIFSNQRFLRISNQWICTCWNIVHDFGRHFSNVSKKHKMLQITVMYIGIRIHFKLYCFWLLFVYIFHTDKVGSKGNLHFSCTLVLHNGFEYISFLLDILYLIDKRCNSTYLSAHDIRIHYLHIFFRRNW